MAKQLLESDFLAVDLSRILRSQRSLDDSEHKALANQQDNVTQGTGAERDLTNVEDWHKELADRLALNEQQPAAERKSEYHIESKFFEDYFTFGDPIWKSNSCTKQLLSLGEPLKEAIKILGFDKKVNPILGFITEDYVVTKIIKTKLLNINTFKAIYTAVAKKLVADSEFFDSNDYNILYCQDLYNKTPAEMLKYLTLQSRILKVSADKYTVADQTKNRKVFFYIDSIKELDPLKRANIVNKKKLAATTVLPKAKSANTMLNSITLSTIISGAGTTTGSNKKATNKENTASNASKVAKELGNAPASMFVALQQLSSVPSAKQALQHDVFKTLTVEDIIGATAKATKTMEQAGLHEDEAKSFVELLVDKLNRIS